MAISDRLLRSRVTPAFFRPLMKRPYDRPCSRAAALMRTIHRRRKSRFLRRRPTNAYLSAVSTDSLADRYSLLLVWKKPFARARSFLRLARRTVPRLTLGMILSGQGRRACPPKTRGLYL